jgi:hypothetical protein
MKNKRQAGSYELQIYPITPSTAFPNLRDYPFQICCKPFKSREISPLGLVTTFWVTLFSTLYNGGNFFSHSGLCGYQKVQNFMLV